MNFPVNFAEGAVLLIDKPEEWTSFDVVKKISRLTGVKAGHAGTLDPLASGLLLVCTGRATGNISVLQNLDKEYSGTFFLGAVTDSYDEETAARNFKDAGQITMAGAAAAAAALEGSIVQKPPAHSAVKVRGKRAYLSARKGKEIAMPLRQVDIRRFTITSLELPLAHFYVSCSKGTYIRTLADDIGKMLGCGAYLKRLRREKIGDYRVEDAWNLGRLITRIEQQYART